MTVRKFGDFFGSLDGLSVPPLVATIGSRWGFVTPSSLSHFSLFLVRSDVLTQGVFTSTSPPSTSNAAVSSNLCCPRLGLTGLYFLPLKLPNFFLPHRPLPAFSVSCGVASPCLRAPKMMPFTPRQRWAWSLYAMVARPQLSVRLHPLLRAVNFFSLWYSGGPNPPG